MDEKSKQITQLQLRDAAFGSNLSSWDSIEGGYTGMSNRYPEFDEELVVVIFSDGRVGLSVAAVRAIGNPERVLFLKNGTLTAIKSSKVAGSSKISGGGGGRHSRILYVSHRAYVRKIGRFSNQKKIKTAWYHYAILTDEGYLLFDHTSPYDTQQWDIVLRD